MSLNVPFDLLAHTTSTHNQMKTIAVIGAGGQSGRECVYQALQNGHRVVAFARTPSKLTYPEGSCPDKKMDLIVHDNLKVVEGDVKNQDHVDNIFNGETIDGVIVALGGRTSSVGPTMLHDGTQNVVNAMKKHNSKRISVITSIGTGDSLGLAPFFFKILIYTVMASIFRDKHNQEQLFLAPEGIGHNLEFSIIRPGGLGNGAPTGVVNVNDGESGSIHRSDLATFCLRAVTEAEFPYLKKASCISSTNGTGWSKEPDKGFDAPMSG